MKNSKLAAAIVAVAGVLMWFIAWQLYDELALWQQFTQADFQNYVAIGILTFYAATGTAGYKLTQAREEQPQHKPKFSHHSNPASNITTNIDDLTVKLAILEKRVTQIDSRVTGLQVFFKNDKGTKGQTPE